MNFKVITLLIFLSSAGVAYAGTWSSPINDPSVPPPSYVCGAFGMWPTSQMPIGSSCAPDGSTYSYGLMSIDECFSGEFELTQNPNNVMRQTCNPSANNPPIANAGVDRTITQPASSVAISGATASDPDGPAPLTTVWSVVSGTPAPTITNGSTLTPTFNGMTSAGNYTFRLTATDGAGMSHQDTMVVTVNVANPQCSDTIDNDGDGRIDSDDWGCHSDNNATNAGSYVSTDNDESNLYCAVPGWGPEQLVFDGWAGSGPGWCNSTPYGTCPSNLGGGPTSLSAKGSPYACCRGFDNLGWIRGCIGSSAQPVAGVCGTSANTTISSEPSSGSAACASGTYTNSPADTGTNWNWTCSGINGGANAACTATKVVACTPNGSFYIWNGINWDDYLSPIWSPNDLIGYSINDQGQVLAGPISVPGNVSGVTASAPSYPSAATTLTCGSAATSCAPTVGGSDIICPQAGCSLPGDNIYPTIPGTDIGMCPGNLAPATLQQGTKCTYGSSFEADFRGTCDCTVFEYAAAPASCSAPVNGACGPGAGNVTPTEPTGSSACSSGIYDNNPADTATNWNWTCTGANGGSSPSCSATKSSSVPTPGCPYGVQATQTTSARSLDETGSYDDNMWGIWAPVCASDTGWDSPHMNNAQSFAATPAYGVPASEVSTFQSAMSSWFPQPGAWEEHDSTTGNTTRLSWALDQWTGSQPDLIPCFATVKIDVCNAPPNYTLTTNISGPVGSGTVTAPNVSCPGDCTESYVAGTTLTVTASANPGYSFVNWSCSTGICNGLTLTQFSINSMSADLNATANFVLSPTFDYSISNSGTSNVTKTAGDAYTTNTITRTLTSGTTEAVTITATGMPAGVSVSYDGNRTCSPNPSCVSTITFTVNSSAAAGTYNITVTSSGDGTPGPRSTNFNLVITQPAGLTVSCAANPTSAMIGDNVTWTATVSGGTPPYTYSWAGTDIPTSPAPTTNPYIKKYETIGTKTGAVTVTDAGSFQATCSPAAITQINFDPSFEEF